MRFPIKFSPVSAAFMTGLGLGRRTAYVEVGSDHVDVRMGYAFRATIPRESIKSVVKQGRIPWTLGIGVHGWGGQWVVNGTLHDIVRVEIEPRAPARVLGVPVKLHDLWVSLEDPDGFQAAVGH